MKRLPVPVLFQVAFVHMISHVHIMVLPALLPLLPDLLNVSFVELGAAVSIFNMVSAFVQAPIGFATDKFGPRNILCAGLVVGSSALFSFAFIPSYACLLVLAALGGIANGAYHPGDYALLSHSVPAARAGRAFAIHSFAGFVGAGVTPLSLTAIASFAGVRAAFAAAGLAGFAVLATFIFSRPSLGELKNRVRQRKNIRNEPARTKPGAPTSVFTMNIAILILLFALLNVNATALERFSVSSFVMGYGTPLSLANTALTAFLFCSALGVLAGGSLADRTKRHGLLAAAATAAGAVLVGILLFHTPPGFVLVPLWAVAGFFTGMIVPSRDMLVRAASPPGAEGKTFGIVSTGLNIGGAVGPIIFGYFLDKAMPKAVFMTSVICLACIVVITLLQERVISGKTR